MKKFTFFLFLFMVLFSGCRKDGNDEPELQNHLTIGNENFTPKSGVIETARWYASGEAMTTFSISIFDHEFTYEQFKNPEEENFTGVNYIGFSLDSAYEHFDYRIEGKNCYEISWDFPGYVIVGFHPENKNEQDLDSGRFCITRKNQLFEIEFEGVTKNDRKKVSLYYLGKLFEYEVFE